MKQIVLIHGGDSFATYDDYLSFLRGFEVKSVDYFKRKADWKTTLQDAVGSGYEILLPQMPNKWNARYAEWKIWFEKLIPFLDDGVVMVGHSLGASFLVRYLAENRFPKRIAATCLISGVYGHGSGTEGMTEEFAAPSSLALLAEQGGTIFLYHSTDDPIVSVSELAKYQADLPDAITRVFNDRGHFFGQDTFPELIADIKSL